MRRIALVLSVLVLLSLACNLSSIGLITQGEHNREVGNLQSQIDQQTTELEALQSRLLETEAALVSTQAELSGTESLIRELGEDLVDYRSLICEDHTWDEFETVVSVWYLEDWYEDPNFSAIYTDWNTGIEMTQWQPYPADWDQYLLTNLLVYDPGRGIVFDVTFHCLILDPRIWTITGP